MSDTSYEGVTIMIECTRPGCIRRFKTVEEMQEHKEADPTHFYCEKCHVDCEDWPDLTQHKVDVMTPYLNNKKKGPCPHWVCEFCGQEFKSRGGRDIHRKEIHKEKNSVTCPFCAKIFFQKSFYIRHLERGQCPHVSAYEFRVRVQEKEILKQELVVPAPVTGYHLPVAAPLKTALISGDDAGNNANPDRFSRPVRSGSDTESTSGGVPLGRASDIQSTSGGVPLGHVSDTQSRGRQRHRDGSKAAKVTVDPYNDKYPALAPPKPIPGAASTRITYTQKWPSLENVQQEEIKVRPAAATVWSNGKASKVLGINSSQDVIPKNAWKNGQSSKICFPDAEPTPAGPEHLDYLEARELSQRTGMIDMSKFDVRLIASEPLRFYNPTIDRYCCAVSSCQSDGWNSWKELKAHVLYAHAWVRWQCPSCLKYFGLPSSFIAHAESGGNCRITEADEFMKFVDDITGGFLAVKQKQVPDLVSMNGLMGEKVPSGIANHEFEAQKPGNLLTIKW